MKHICLIWSMFCSRELQWMWVEVLEPAHEHAQCSGRQLASGRISEGRALYSTVCWHTHSSWPDSAALNRLLHSHFPTCLSVHHLSVLFLALVLPSVTFCYFWPKICIFVVVVSPQLTDSWICPVGCINSCCSCYHNLLLSSSSSVSAVGDVACVCLWLLVAALLLPVDVCTFELLSQSSFAARRLESLVVS